MVDSFRVVGLAHQRARRGFGLHLGEHDLLARADAGRACRMLLVNPVRRGPHYRSGTGGLEAVTHIGSSRSNSAPHRSHTMR